MLEKEINEVLRESGHDYVAQLIQGEEERQAKNIELIASENFPSEAVKAAAASCFVAKYSEGYPRERTLGSKGRYYGGCENVDLLEEYCVQKWKEVFHTDYHVNVQPHAGSQANFAAYMGVLDPGDTILSMNLDNGGHLTHGSNVNFSGKFFRFVTYGVDSNGFIDLKDMERKIRQYRPRMVLVGASAYSRIFDFEKIRELIDQAAEACVKKEGTYADGYDRPYFMVDMAHIAGLVAAGDHPTPFGYADIITTTTHKTLRATRGGLIFCRPELAKQIDSGVFPGSQGGPLEHIIAAKAVTAEEACTPQFIEYIHHVVENTKAMCDEFIKMGYEIVTGGTDNHLFLVDFTRTHPDITGKMVQDELDKYGITLNKNCVPNEKRSPVRTSGVRIGCAAMTTKGYTKEQFIETAHKIDSVITQLQKTQSENRA